VKQAYQSATNGFSRLLVGTSGSLCFINNSRQLVEVVSTWPATGAGLGDESMLEDIYSPESCCGLRSGHPRWRVPRISEIHCTHFAGSPPQRYLCLPIVAHGNTMGVLFVQCHDEATVELVNRHMDGLRQLVQFTGMAVATLNLRTKLENQSIRDSLTGLFNRHFMQISLERELARATRRKQSLAVFMLDLDQFKKFNDTYGHAAGDMVLKAIADIFLASIRSEDIACRYGGEEFTIILPDITAAAALERAESVRLAVMNLRMPLEQEVYGDFTVSIGVALYPNDGEAADLLLRRADQALYRAKRSGRNQVAIHEAGVPVA
jgi:diguanylate cyclase (GGDEF)-like protein